MSDGSPIFNKKETRESVFHSSMGNCVQRLMSVQIFLHFHFSRLSNVHMRDRESRLAHYIFDIDFPNAAGFSLFFSFFF